MRRTKNCVRIVPLSCLTQHSTCYKLVFFMFESLRSSQFYSVGLVHHDQIYSKASFKNYVFAHIQLYY